ncbi:MULTISPECIES: hypothetical protein [Rhizobium]|uniref:DUF1328 domain-containing protein n=1 Tax=Rhizobium lusitanum TaxID=293958 RepID=A0A1C3X4U3_9HYPH|nr:hypothetical protein [Rhizobium lusitanum]NRP89927.1 hypothetical protein [Ensifer adhaerens]NTJ09216.1 hypothetical protein [Rhizobium lusitanum]SCB47273.1 hypothetical protein GA0061101_12524 [Rhizobium lusitanum]
MIGWLVRILMLGAGIVAGWFVPRDQLGYTIVQFVVLLLLVLVISVVLLYFPIHRGRTKRPPPKNLNDG